MAGHRHGRILCGAVLPPRSMKACKCGARVPAGTACAKCNTPLPAWCARWLDADDERCDLHVGLERHPQAPLTPLAAIMSSAPPEVVALAEAIGERSHLEQAEMAARSLTLLAIQHGDQRHWDAVAAVQERCAKIAALEREAGASTQQHGTTTIIYTETASGTAAPATAADDHDTLED